jgi:Protein of unknown function (DUF2800)
MNAHAPFSPSGSERWMNCPGSFRAEQEAGPRPTSMYAEEGTGAHTIFAEALRRNISPYRLMTDTYIAKPLHEAWLAAKQLIAGRHFLVEQRLPPLPGMPDLWGTADIIVFDHHGHVVMVIDLKFGSGVVVEPDSVQLAIYALLAAQQYGGSPAGITTVILQPRALHAAGPVRQHLHVPAALDALLCALQAGMGAARITEAARVSGLWCRFCAAAHRCSERHHNLPQSGHSLWHQGSPSA